MNWRQLFSPCAFGHEDPIKVIRGKALVLQCPRCCQDLRTIAKLKAKYRDKSKVVRTFPQRKRA